MIRIRQMKIMNSDVKIKIQVAENEHEKKRLPMLRRRQIAYIICSFCTINDVRRRAIGLDDLPNIEVRNDNLKRFQQAWEETWIVVEKEPERDFLDSFYRRHLDQLTRVKNALSQYHFSSLLNEKSRIIF